MQLLLWAFASRKLPILQLCWEMESHNEFASEAQQIKIQTTQIQVNAWMIFWIWFYMVLCCIHEPRKVMKPKKESCIQPHQLQLTSFSCYSQSCSICWISINLCILSQKQFCNSDMAMFWSCPQGTSTSRIADVKGALVLKKKPYDLNSVTFCRLKDEVGMFHKYCILAYASIYNKQCQPLNAKTPTGLCSSKLENQTRWSLQMSGFCSKPQGSGRLSLVGIRPSLKQQANHFSMTAPGCHYQWCGA